MSDDEADPELLELLRQTLGLGKKERSDEVSSDTGVLKDAEYIYTNAIDVSIDMWGTKGAAALIHKTMQERSYSTEQWSQQELHPTPEEGFSDVDVVNFVFTMDLLNFSFWSDLAETERFQVEYQGKRWTGYKSLLACLRRALDEGIPITTPKLWSDPNISDETLKQVFRSATTEQMPLLDERIAMLREVGTELTESFGDPDRHADSEMADAVDQNQETEDPADVVAEPSQMPMDGAGPTSSNDKPEEPPTEALDSLRLNRVVSSTEAGASKEERSASQEESGEAVEAAQSDTQAKEEESLPAHPRASVEPDHSIIRLIEKANRSAGKLANLLAKHFPSFRDETRFDGRRVRLLKRAQIFVADLWAAMNGQGYGTFNDIDHLTMFADYRVPQMLHSLGVLVYSPPLTNLIRTQQELSSGHSWEVQLRGCTIWAVELIRREILRQDPSATNVNAVLIDFFLYDLAKEREAAEGDLFSLAGANHSFGSV